MVTCAVCCPLSDAMLDEDEEAGIFEGVEDTQEDVEDIEIDTLHPMPDIDSIFTQDNISYLESKHYDVGLVNDVYKQCKKYENACSTNPLSAFHLFTHNGVASNLDDVKAMLVEINKLIMKANTGKKYSFTWCLTLKSLLWCMVIETRDVHSSSRKSKT